MPTQDSRIRICVDLTKLNQSFQREHHPILSKDHNLAQLGGAKIFSKLDTNSGFWQISLQKKTQPSLLLTLLGRFCFNQLPFRITSALKYFQKRMNEILLGLEGVVCMMDDALVYA